MIYPFSKELVLVGGGHTHALVLRAWGMNPLPGARLTLINPGATAPYTGMLPGFVAGHYDRDALEIDLVKLCHHAGARLILDSAVSMDRATRQIELRGGRTVAYDVASINIGITSEPIAIDGFKQFGIAAKPLGAFAGAWTRAKAAKIGAAAIIGGGVGGCELALAMRHALGSEPDIAVVDRGEIPSGMSQRGAANLVQNLKHHRILCHEQADIKSISDNSISLDDGTTLPSDFTVGAAGARASPWLDQIGLETTDGFLNILPSLQTSDPSIFAAGDCAHMVAAPRPRAGVFAVRQAPVLGQNLRAALSGKRLKEYKPQKRYLKLISLGGKSALAERFGVAIAGPALWRWKDRIDRAFMDRLNDLPPMTQAALPPERALTDALPDTPMCSGCGSKVAAGSLEAALADLPGIIRSDVTTLPGDDAAVVSFGDTRQVISTDMLRAVTTDPHLAARIAAVHALGDIWAMGAKPQTALAQVILPRMSTGMQAEWLRDVMSAAAGVFAAAGANIAGGHSAMGAELTIGFTVTGILDGAPITLAGARSGDRLILTKPLGTGTILAAQMRGRARAAWVISAWQSMGAPQGSAATILRNANAMTDVTGFGLAGHLSNICNASGVGAALDLNALPLLPGAEEMAAAGVRSTIWQDNRAAAIVDAPDTARAALLFDPQTAGGLLASVAEADAPGILQALGDAGYDAADIGRMTETPGITAR